MSRSFEELMRIVNEADCDERTITIHYNSPHGSDKIEYVIGSDFKTKEEAIQDFKDDRGPAYKITKVTDDMVSENESFGVNFETPCDMPMAARVTNTRAAYSQTTQDGDASVTVTATGEDMAEIHRVLALAGVPVNCSVTDQEMEPQLQDQMCDMDDYADCPEYTLDKDDILGKLQGRLVNHFGR